MNPRRWWWRLGIGVVSFAVLEVVFVVVEFEPDALRLALLVALAVSGTGLVLDSLSDTGTSWQVVGSAATGPQGQDLRTLRHLSLLEGHLTARTPDPALRDRLAVLADLALRQRHDLTRHDAGAAALLGPHLSGILDGAPRRLSRADIDACVRRIEEL